MAASLPVCRTSWEPFSSPGAKRHRVTARSLPLFPSLAKTEWAQLNCLFGVDTVPSPWPSIAWEGVYQLRPARQNQSRSRCPILLCFLVQAQPGGADLRCLPGLWGGCTRCPPMIPSPRLYREDGDTLLVAQVLAQTPALGFNSVLSRAGSNHAAQTASAITSL